MKFYSAKVLLKGSQINQVPKDRLSPAEIIVLRSIHGSDAVVDIKPSKAMKPQRNDRTPDIIELVPAESRYKWRPQDDAAERERLQTIYATALNRPGRNLVTLFGPPHNPLPKELPDMAAEPEVETELTA